MIPDGDMVGKRRGWRVRLRWLATPLAAVVAGAAAVPGVAVPVASSSQEDREEDREPPAMVLVMDASGSMAEPSGTGGSRMDAAKQALTEVVNSVPEQAQVGLRVYGSTISDGPGSCEDSQLAVPVGPVDRGALLGAVENLEPLGNTPLAYSLEQAAGDLPDEGQQVIVLISDGEENCGGQACEVAGQLVESGIDVRIDVVGFQVGSQARNELACIADAGGGTYYDAPDADSLAAQLQRVSVRGLRVFTPGGTPVDGTPGPQDAPMLDDGRYLDELVGTEPKHYRTDVPEGSSLWVAATVKPMLASLTDRADIGVEVLSASGASCDEHVMRGVGASHRALPLTGAIVLTSDGLRSCGTGPYVLRVEQAVDGPDETKEVELLVGHEPAVTSTDQLPAAAGNADWSAEAPAASGTPQAAVGAPSMAAASELDPGRYTDTILVGETLFYGVALDWGQQLSCHATLGASPVLAEGLGTPPPLARSHVYAPYRGELSLPGTQGGDFYDGSSDVRLTSTTPPVRYLNRENIAARYASVAGTYFCAVTLTGNPEYAGAGEVPVELVIDVTGQAGEGAPEYVEPTPESTAEPEPSALPSESGSESPQQPAGSVDDPGEPAGNTWWVVAALVLVALLTAAAVALFARRNRAGEPD